MQQIVTRNSLVRNPQIGVAVNIDSPQNSNSPSYNKSEKNNSPIVIN